MTHTDQHQTFSPDFEKSAPAYLWWNGRRVPWASATVHLTSTFWSGVTAIFEGIMSYWNEEQHELYIWQLDAHLRRLLRSQKLMRQASPYSVAELTDAVVDLVRALDVSGDTYIFPYCYPQGGGNFESSTSATPQPVDIAITARPNASHLGKGWVRSACVSSYTRIADNVMPPRVKNIANYRNSNLAMAEARIGISGWRYPNWRRSFYPTGLRQAVELAYASERMTSIEVNGSFYGLLQDDPKGQGVGLPLVGSAGALVAFPSHMIHGVTPVTHGRRYTIASWFSAGTD